MHLLSPGSSELVSLSSPVAPPSPEVQERLAALSVDEPLPETYSSNLARLLVQSPYKLFLYWSHARDPFATLRKAFGETQSSYTLAVRLRDTESGAENFFEASPTHSQWFDASPGRSYRADVGLFAPERPFIRLLSSDVIQTPRVGVSARSDHTPEFNITAPEFARVLNEAGFARDALGVTLEAADKAAQAATTRALTKMGAGLEIPAIGEDEWAELSALVAALVFGEPLDHLLARLSPPLAQWFEQIRQEMGGALDAAYLLDLLRELFAIELDDEDSERARAAWRAMRLMQGASDVYTPPRPPRLIRKRPPPFSVPSMAEGLSSMLARWRRL